MIKISNRWDNRVLYTAEHAQGIRQAVKEARAHGADLRGADLRGADLSGANLCAANLRGADLCAANLRGADLSGANLCAANLRGADLCAANLRGADLSGATLREANLSGATLRGANLHAANLYAANLHGANFHGADLRGANLHGADLRGANLHGADLRGANFHGADLRGVNGIVPERCTDLLMLRDQVGKIRAYKLTRPDGTGPTYRGLTYEVGETVEVEDADTDPGTHCGPGVNLATLPWCLREWRPGYRIFVCEFKAKDIAAIPTATDGKFRVHRCKVVREIPAEQIEEWINPSEEPAHERAERR